MKNGAGFRRRGKCDSCFYARSIARNVKITLADLRPCEFNQTWFDLFADDAPTETIAVWLRWARLNEENWRINNASVADDDDD